MRLTTLTPKTSPERASVPLDREIDPEEFRKGTAGVFGLGDTAADNRPWYKRWYVWVLPAAVLFGVLIVGVTAR